MSYDLRSTTVGGDADPGLRVFPEGASDVRLLFRAVLPGDRLLDERQYPSRHEAGGPYN
jgi:hypothetical protein